MFDYCTCFSHWVYFAGDHGSLFKTEYAGEFVRFSLSMQRNSSFTYRVCGGIGHIHTEYAEEFVRFIQSMRKSEMVRVKLNLFIYAEVCFPKRSEMGLDRQEQAHRLHRSLELKHRPLE